MANDVFNTIQEKIKLFKNNNLNRWKENWSNMK